MGRKKHHHFSQEVADRVRTLSGIGLNEDQIATVEKISKSTLRRFYLKEVHEGREQAISQVSKTAYQMAISGKVPAMTMFWLKTRAQWREVQRVEHSGPDGKAIETKENITFDTQWRSLPSKNEKGDS